MAFNFSNGDTLSSKYLKESDLIDGYIGNKLYAWGYNGQYGVHNNNIAQHITVPMQVMLPLGG